MQKRSVRAVTLVAVAVMSLVAARSTYGEIVISLQEVGNDVVGTASGSANLTGLRSAGLGSDGPRVDSSSAYLLVGQSGLSDMYRDLASSPNSFGSGGGVGTGGAGGLVGSTFGRLYVPKGYVSGDPVSSSAIWENHTLSSLGVTPGTYEWTWGTGGNADTLTLYAGVTPPPTGTVPTLSEWGMIALVLLLGAAAVSVQAKRRKSLAGA